MMINNLSKVLIISLGTFTQLFLTFFIWESANNITNILLFYLVMFVAIPVSSFFSAFICDRIDPKVSLIAGTLFTILELTFLMYFSNNLVYQNIAILGLLGGISEGLKNVSFNVIFLNINGNYSKEKFYAKRAIITQLSTLLLPIPTAFIISYTGSYFILFKFIIALLVVSSILNALITTDENTNKFNIKAIFKFPGSNKDKDILAKGEFLEGMAEGITLTILPVLLLSYTGSILNWSYINTIFALCAILGGILIDLTINNAESKLIYAAAAFIFAASNIFFLTKLNIYIILIFLFAKMFMDLIKDISYNADIIKISELDSSISSLQSEYEFFQETFTGLGRVIVVAFLLILGVSFDNSLNIRLVLLAVGVTPLITLSILGRSKIFSGNIKKASIYHNFKKIKNIASFKNVEVIEVSDKNTLAVPKSVNLISSHNDDLKKDSIETKEPSTEDLPSLSVPA